MALSESLSCEASADECLPNGMVVNTIDACATIPELHNAKVSSEALVLHEDSLDAACHAASRSIDQLLWQGGADVAKAVALIGPGIMVLPMFAKVSGVDDGHCLSYSSHPKRAAKGGLMDRVDFESKFGRCEPNMLLRELAGGKEGLDARIKRLSDEELQGEVTALQDWRLKANGRMRTLEKRAAYAFIGIRAGSVDRAAIKRAFKRRALELHPDKGGDAERFQLLQEMKDLLIEPSPLELEEKSKEEKEREQEQEKESSKDKEPGKEDKVASEKEAEADEFDDTDFSDDSYDVDEELKKMFPKDKKKKRRRPDQDDDFDELGVDKEFNRDRHIAARRKLHRNITEMWERAGRLVDEIRQTQNEATGEAIRTLRKFVERFANVEISKLKENDPKKADRIYRRFLEQGSEVICAAGAVDPVGTVSSVAMHINYPLLAKAPSAELQQRCSALVDAIESLPTIFKKHVGPMEELLSDRQRVAKETESVVRNSPLHIILCMPDPTLMVQHGNVELPAVREAEIDMPAGSSVGDLRAAGLQVFGRAVARLFCGGRFLGNDKVPLAKVAELIAGAPVHCLPSNKILPQQRTVELPTIDGPASENSASNPHALPKGAVEAAAKAAAERRQGKATSNLDSTSLVAMPKAGPETVVDKERFSEEVRSEHGPAVDGKSSVEGKAHDREGQSEHGLADDTRTMEKKVIPTEGEDDDDDDEEDDFFDDFFDSAKKAADAKAKKEQEEAAKKEEDQKRRREAQEALEAKQRAEEKAQRKDIQEKGLSAMEKRLQAQKQAAEAKKKIEEEKKKKLAEGKRKDEQKQHANSAREERKPQTLESKSDRMSELLGLRKKDADIKCQDLVISKEDLPEHALRHLRTCWNENWEHSCAGERREDGSAIFCYPCNAWISMAEAFNHRTFELHCENVGHYGWID